jgi:hypothetical protein
VSFRNCTRTRTRPIPSAQDQRSFRRGYHESWYRHSSQHGRLCQPHLRDEPRRQHERPVHLEEKHYFWSLHSHTKSHTLRDFVHIFNRAIADGGKNGLGGCRGRKGGGGEQTDEDKRGAKQGESNHGDVRRLIWSISDGCWELGGSNAQESENSREGAWGYQVASRRSLYSS